MVISGQLTIFAVRINNLHFLPQNTVNMRKKLLSLLALLGLTVFAASAQLFTTSPAILQESSENVVLKFHANNCDVAALKNSTSDLYAHIGVYTTKSPSTWIHIKEDWGSNKPSNTFKRGSGNVYELTIGDLRTYFGVTDPSERITKVCVIARNAAGSAQTADNFIDVYEEGYAMAFTSSPANTIITKSTTISFTAYATEASSIKIYVDGVE